MFNALVRKILGLKDGSAEAATSEAASSEPRTDEYGALWMRQRIGTSVASLADVSVTTAAPLAALPCGPTGILVTAHPGNGGEIVRVSGSDVSTSKGQPLAAGASYTFGVHDASDLYACTESGSAATLCVSAV